MKKQTKNKPWFSRFDHDRIASHIFPELGEMMVEDVKKERDQQMKIDGYEVIGSGTDRTRSIIGQLEELSELYEWPVIEKWLFNNRKRWAIYDNEEIGRLFDMMHRDEKKKFLGSLVDYYDVETDIVVGHVR
jgi:hypothetical protein